MGWGLQSRQDFQQSHSLIEPKGSYDPNLKCATLMAQGASECAMQGINTENGMRFCAMEPEGKMGVCKVCPNGFFKRLVVLAEGFEECVLLTEGFKECVLLNECLEESVLLN